MLESSLKSFILLLPAQHVCMQVTIIENSSKCRSACHGSYAAVPFPHPSQTDVKQCHLSSVEAMHGFCILRGLTDQYLSTAVSLEIGIGKHYNYYKDNPVDLAKSNLTT